MSLLIVRYSDSGNARWGKLVGPAPYSPKDTIDVAALEKDFATTAELISAYDSQRDLATSEPVTLSARALLSPITKDATLICQGLNYETHAAEAGHKKRKANLIFTKASSTITGPYSEIVTPEGVELLDYEIEIGMVLRQSVEGVTEVDNESIGDYIAGFVLANDVSARDTMFGAGFFQWYQGKSFRTFCPLGPVLYLLDRSDVARIIDKLSISLSRGSDEMQSAISGDQIYKAPETISGISKFMDAKAGDLILTGTPGGVIANGTPNILGILKDNLVKDEARRAALVAEFKLQETFLQKGEVLTLTLKDDANDLPLGGQRSVIA